VVYGFVSFTIITTVKVFLSGGNKKKSGQTQIYACDVNLAGLFKGKSSQKRGFVLIY
jgi:hypothetical protein